MNSASFQSLIQNIDTLIDLHTRNECVWSDFFVIARERLQKDPVFGAQFFVTAWGGMFNYEDTGILARVDDEKIRQQAANQAYALARELAK
jgi:hypothetical protein